VRLAVEELGFASAVRVPEVALARVAGAAGQSGLLRVRQTPVVPLAAQRLEPVSSFYIF